MKKMFFLLISLGVFLFGARGVMADSASFGGSGNTVKMLDSNEVKMVKELIKIDVYDKPKYSPKYGWISNPATIDVSYKFKNTTNKKITVKMGFPEKCNGENGCSLDDKNMLKESIPLHIKLGKSDSWYDFYKLIDFSTFDNKKKVNVTFRGDIEAKTPGINWYTFKIDFNPGEEKIIRNTYWISGRAGKVGIDFEYILETGASWKDRIDNIDVLVTNHDNLSIYDVNKADPAGYIFNKKNNTFEWHLKNIEPTAKDNILVSYRLKGEQRQILDDPSSSFLAHDKFDYYPMNAEDNLLNTSWVEGVKGAGIGEWIEVSRLVENKTYEKMKIFAGYGTSKTLWQKNNRVKKIKVIFSGPECPPPDPNGYNVTCKEKKIGEQVFNLADKFEYQTFNLTPKISGVNSAKLEILDVYKGTKFDDTAIAEVDFLGLLTAAKTK